ncbi:hypothetical protein Psta_1643 [Pirellula staleyi DSM 6068]|uniref:Esterase n=1 Tax=Pirellula staleyi (strain ATCC 27377 / DSM 6068 / ICPB 4128) TaxID=530564 RepID=D2QYA4_PIRSD|nr:alpha/beta hydrolase-fold protein [Pirellula staleyi]ADB16318.1 hypothetical protein Psta_1643 [Pirellula staleyi DSM 6068]
MGLATKEPEWTTSGPVVSAEGTWTLETIDGHPCDLFQPAKPSPHKYTVLYLHGVHLNRLVDKRVFVEQFGKYGLNVVCPRTERSWWTDRICTEFSTKYSAQQFVMELVLPWIKQRLGCEPPRIALLGTSMGGQGALRFSYKFPNIFPIAAAISPAIDYQLRYDEGDVTIPQMYSDPEAARQDTALLHVHPLNWPRHQFFACDPEDTRWWDSADRLRMKLYSLGVPHTCDMETSGGGHSFEYYQLLAPTAVKFVFDALEQERLRLL